MRTFVRILAGLIAAMLAAAMTVVLFALPPTELVTLEETARGERLFEIGGLVLRAATHALIFCAGFAPIVILIAEWQRLRSWPFYVIVGVVIAAGGFLAQYVSENAAQPTILNNYALVAFVTMGAVGGLVYWMLAGRHAGARRSAEEVEAPADIEADADTETETSTRTEADTVVVTEVATAAVPLAPSAAGSSGVKAGTPVPPAASAGVPTGQARVQSTKVASSTARPTPTDDAAAGTNNAAQPATSVPSAGSPQPAKRRSAEDPDLGSADSGLEPEKS